MWGERLRLTDRIEELKDKVRELEEDYKSGEISKTDYNIIRERYMDEIEELKQEIKERRREPVANRVWLVIGLIGGVLASISVTLPWSASASVSGLELVSVEFFAPALVLMGGLYAAFGGVCMLVSRIMGSAFGIGGTITLTGVIWGFTLKADFASIAAGQGPGIGYGIYIALIGAIIAFFGKLGS